MHLSDVELVDLAEGARPESSAPHLRTCDRCRQQVLELRRMMSAAAAVPVPEPSPLFWEHFSDRVRDAVVVEAAAPRRWWQGVASARRVLIPASAVALIALLVAGVATSRGPRIAVMSSAEHTQPYGVAPDLDASSDAFDAGAVEDDSLTLMANLSSAIDVDLVSDVVLAPTAGADHAVTSLNHDELRELQRLLNELAPSGV
jgi:hypothetical protein